jgi:hypothetical protein
LISCLTIGQQKQHIIEAAPFVGSNFTLTPAVDYTFTSYGLHLKHVKRRTEYKNWQQYFNLPNTGQELLLAQYSYNGYSITLNTFIEFDFLRSERHELFISPSLGLAYTSETSASIIDYRLVSLPINVSTKIALGYRYMISPTCNISTEYLLSHFSNGNISSPNDGLNMKAWRLGLGYTFGEDYSADHQPYEKSQYDRFYSQVSIGMSLKSNSNNDYYGFVNGYANIGLSFHPFHRIIGGVGIFMNNPYSSIRATPQTGICLGYQIIVGRIGFLFQPGWYMNSPKRYYQISLQYYLDSPLFINASLRTTKQFFSEDLAFGIGIDF